MGSYGSSKHISRCSDNRFILSRPKWLAEWRGTQWCAYSNMGSTEACADSWQDRLWDTQPGLCNGWKRLLSAARENQLMPATDQLTRDFAGTRLRGNKGLKETMLLTPGKLTDEPYFKPGNDKR
ncbi:hypothetical protein DR999_PMT02364 [Platysternon megacephalum]|uniref:Uncharacterized protein n=1 Tax=Platysternon megacephalum TaxID=55544 RepID=A0A4D9F3J7_9SAUR|nr:hypothetical protein DR999_PMT02364 [Platysternon megacephalum]